VRGFSAALVDLDFAGGRYRNGVGSAYVSDPADLAGWSYSRASGGEYARTSSGLLVPFAAGEPPITDLGLDVWQASTNLMKWSQSLSNAAWTKDNSSIGGTLTGPDGVAGSAIHLVEAVTNTRHQLYQAITGVAGSYAANAIVQAAERSWAHLQIYDGTDREVYFNLAGGLKGSEVGGATGSMIHLGGGWYWIRMTVTTTAANPIIALGADTESGSIGYVGISGWGINVYAIWGEAGAKSTPLTPTTSASVSRSVGLAALGGLSGLASGTLYVDGTSSLSGNVQVFASLNDGTSDKRIQIGGGANAYLESSGATASFGGANYVANTAVKVALAFADGEQTLVVNGGAPTTGALATIPTVTQLNIGNGPSGITPINGPARRAAVFSRALSVAEMQALTG
jgi:hypothetical protein